MKIYIGYCSHEAFKFLEFPNYLLRLPVVLPLSYKLLIGRARGVKFVRGTVLCEHNFCRMINGS